MYRERTGGSFFGGYGYILTSMKNAGCCNIFKKWLVTKALSLAFSTEKKSAKQCSLLYKINLEQAV